MTDLLLFLRAENTAGEIECFRGERPRCRDGISKSRRQGRTLPRRAENSSDFLAGGRLSPRARASDWARSRAFSRQIAE
jgi:hypothetical protein